MRGIKEETEVQGGEPPKPDVGEPKPEGEDGAGEPSGKKPKLNKPTEEKLASDATVSDLEKMLAEARASMSGGALPS